jgi:membrane-bound serine protease (ClpP class)
LVGHTAVAVSALAPEGRVRFEGELWRAHSDTPVAAGDRVRITGMDGLTLQVTPVDEAADEE